MALLSAADILTLRRSCLQDLLDDHVEIGTSAVTTGTAAAGTYSVSLTGLGSGVIQAGTRLVLKPGGRHNTHEVAIGATITASAATVTVAPAVHVTVSAGTVVSPVPEKIGLWVEKRNAQFWTDSALEAYAQEASISYRWQIAQSPQPSITLYRGIQCLAFTELLNSAQYLALLLQIDPSGSTVQAERIRLGSIVSQAKAAMQPASYGGFSVGRIR